MYNHLMHTLDLVGELSWVALENVCAVSEANTQITGHGRQGGGSGGHGGGRGCAPMPVRNCEVEDESGNFQL